MADHYPFENEESEDKRVEVEEDEEKASAALDTWFRIANLTGHYSKRISVLEIS